MEIESEYGRKEDGSFLIHARTFFLTYPHCDLGSDILRDFLVTERGVSRYIVCNELHEDGSPHLHALIIYDKAKRITNDGYFNIRGYHPNIQRGRNTKAIFEYCRKDGNYITNMDESAKELRPPYSKLIMESTSAHEFIEKIICYYPEVAIRSWASIKAFAADRYGSKIDLRDSIEGLNFFIIPNDLQHWIDNYLGIRNKRGRSLILVSPSRFGKTSLFFWLAKQKDGEINYYNSNFNLSEWNPNAIFNVFDDFDSFDYVPAKKFFFGMQLCADLTDKYKGKRRLFRTGPSIFLCNPDCDPSIKWTTEQLNYWSANLDIIYLSQPLYLSDV